MNKTKKLREIFEENDSSKLVLPDFQRALEWKVEDQKRLLSSLLVSLPIGSLLLLEGNKNDFAAKELCFPNAIANPKEECIYLLDGQQRVSSLKSIFSDYFHDFNKWKDVYEEIYKDLRNRWFIRVVPKEDEEDIFGWRNLRFNGLKTHEPSDLFNIIVVRKIFKTKTSDWYNPGYTPVDQDNKPLGKTSRLNNIASHAAKEGLVPLYTIYPNTSLSLHEKTLSEIARIRVEQLKADVNDGKLALEDVLGFLDSDVNEIEDEEELRDLWSRLGAKWSESVLHALNNILEESIPVISLPSSEVGRAVSIFENINRGGTPLDTYDLIVAKSARNKNLKSLTDRIKSNLETEIMLPHSLVHHIVSPKPEKWNPINFSIIVDNNLTKEVKEQYLNLLSIISYTKYGSVENIKRDLVKKNKILDLDYEQVNSNTKTTVDSLKRAFAFLHFRCGIVSFESLPYKLMILPIAYSLRDDKIWNNRTMIDRIEFWYWGSIFSGAYRYSQNEQCFNDIKNLYQWLVGEKNHYKNLPDKIFTDPGYSDIDTLLLKKDDNRSVPSAISRSILHYILSNQPKDFLVKDNEGKEIRLNVWDISSKKEIKYAGESKVIDLQDHHIFPLGNATKIGESSQVIRRDKSHILNSPLNRTYISSIANSKIRDKSINDYLKYISQLTLDGHCIPNKSSYFKKTDENEVEYFERVLRERFELLFRDLRIELGNLNP